MDAKGVEARARLLGASVNIGSFSNCLQGNLSNYPVHHAARGPTCAIRDLLLFPDLVTRRDHSLSTFTCDIEIVVAMASIG